MRFAFPPYACCFRLLNGRSIGEMVTLATCSLAVFRAVDERLKSRTSDDTVELLDDIGMPVGLVRLP